MPDYQKNILEALHEGQNHKGQNPTESLEEVVTGDIVTGQTCATAFRFKDKDDKEGKFYGAGTTELGKENKPTEETMFFVGSVAKTFTAVAAFHMVAQGVFGPVGPEGGLNTNLHENADRWAEYLKKAHPDLTQTNIDDFKKLIKEGTFPDATLLDLIGHRSGIGNNHQGAKEGNKPTAGMIDIGLRKYNFKEGAKRIPGCEYSNAGYALLGMIMEAQMEKPLAEIIQKEVIDHYKLKKTMVIQTYMGSSDQKKKEYSIAKLYGLAETGLDSSDDRDVAGGAANILSSPRDLAIFFREIATNPELEGMRKAQEPPGYTGFNEAGHGVMINYSLGKEGSEEKEWVRHPGAAGQGGIAADVVANTKTGEVIVFTATPFVNIQEQTVAGKFGIHEDNWPKALPIIREGMQSALKEREIPLNPKDVTPEHFKGFNAKAVWEKLKEKVEQALTQPSSPTPDIDPQSDKIDVVSGQIRTKANEPGTDKTQRQ